MCSANTAARPVSRKALTSWTDPAISSLTWHNWPSAGTAQFRKPFCCRIWLLYGIKSDVPGVRCLLACPAGPDPLAARGLPAVLARADPAGGHSRQEQPLWGSAGFVVWRDADSTQ